VLLVVAFVATGVLQSSEASQLHATVVKEDPANYTPQVMDDATITSAAVYALAQSGGTGYAGGTFRTVRNASRTIAYTRYNLVSYNATNGAVNAFAPNLNGAVWGLAASGNALYVGGHFTTANGVARRGVVKLDGTTGAVDPAFNAALPSGKVNELRLVNGRLIIGGTFPKRLAALNPTTGADTGFINVPITGTLADNAGATSIYRFAVHPLGTRLVGIGNFTTVGGQTRHRAFMLNLDGAAATLNAWNYLPLQRFCYLTSMPEYLRDVDFSPGGDYFVLVATGYLPALSTHYGTSICDAAARFETNVPAPTKPTWINYTGGDTLHSVAVTGAAVYVQGHQRWLDNPLGRNSKGPGAVDRKGIGAIHPLTGKALAWNPGKEGGVGGKEMLATSTGLWIGHDTRYVRGEFHEGLAFFPL
jgi:hypothetical protein